MAATPPYPDQFLQGAPSPFTLDMAPELIGTSQSRPTIYFIDDFDPYYYHIAGCDVGVDYFASATMRTPADASEDEPTLREIKQFPERPQISETPELPSNSQQNVATLEKLTSMIEKPKSSNTITLTRRQPQSSRVAASKTGLVEKRASKEMRVERNRKSAMKFRRKSKEREGDLEARKAVLETKHRILKEEYADLLRETLKLKSDIIRHAGCNDCRQCWIDTL
jgi:hypothetical protein